MALLAFPAGICPQTQVWSMYAPKNRFESGSGAVLEKPVMIPRWRVSMTFFKLRDDLKLLEVLIDRLKTGDTVAVPYFARPIIIGLSGTVRANGAASGSQFNVDGFTGVIKAGDFFQIGGELKRVIEDRNGAGLLKFVPALRGAHADNTIIATTNPSCAFTLAGDETGSINSVPGFSTIGLDLIEKL